MADEDLHRLFAEQRASVEDLDEETAVMLFQTGESRRYTVDQMMWQVPALSLTAQAFLLQIAYGHTSNWVARLVAATLGFITAAAAVQLLLKHRYHEEMHSFWLERFAAVRGWPIMHGPRCPEAFAYGGRPHAWKGTRLGWIAHFRSPRVWIATLGLFAAADLVVVGGWIDHLVSGANPFG